MRPIITILAIIILAAVAEWYGPWWSCALVAGIAGLLSRLRTGEAFVAGFMGVGIMWLLFFLAKDLGSHHVLSQKMAQTFHLPSYLFYIIVTFLLGGLTGGIPCWAGAELRKVFRPKSFAPES